MCVCECVFLPMGSLYNLKTDTQVRQYNNNCDRDKREKEIDFTTSPSDVQSARSLTINRTDMHISLSVRGLVLNSPRSRLAVLLDPFVGYYTTQIIFLSNCTHSTYIHLRYYCINHLLT